MSSHPNAILMAVLTPDDGARKTHRAILETLGIDDDDEGFRLPGIDNHFSINVMKSDYEEDDQISAPEGSIVAHTFITYGYGDVITWAKLEEMKAALEAWAKDMCTQHKCTYEIQLTANFW